VCSLDGLTFLEVSALFYNDMKKVKNKIKHKIKQTNKKNDNDS